MRMLQLRKSAYRQAASSGSACCSECGMEFKTALNMTRHMRLVHWRQYKNLCPFCGKGTKTKADLVGHMATKHNIPKEFQCPICARQFAYKNGMKSHMRDQHGSMAVPQE